MQAELFTFNQRSNEKIFIRIGINTGTVFVKNEDVFGEAVNIAARMENLAKPGRIFITETTYDKLSGRIPCSDLGYHQVKGKSEPLRVFSLQDNANSEEMAKMAAQYMQEAGIQAVEQPAMEAQPPEGSHQPAKSAAPVAASNQVSSAARTPGSSAAKSSAPQARPTASVLPDISDAALAQSPAEAAISATTLPPHKQILQSVDLARNSYISSVKKGKERNPDLEDWFARFEEYLRPKIEQ
jgi:hypothetical protein